MKKQIIFLFALLPAVFCAGCGRAAAPPVQAQEAVPEEELGGRIEETGGSPMEKTLRLWIGDTEVAVDWEENESVDALLRLASAEPLAVPMSRYGGFEQVGSLGTSLPRNDVQTTTQSGDIVLYAGNQIVVFYGSNAWAYTRLGHITNVPAEDMTKLLANGDVVITLSLEQVEE